MKKTACLIALVLVLSLTASLVSCKTPGQDDTTTPSDSSSYQVITKAPDSDTTTPSDTTLPSSDTTTSTSGDPTTPADTTVITPPEIVWTDVEKTVYVSDENVWVRKSPDLDDASRDVVLHLGDKLTCTGTSESWCRVVYGGEVRYISSAYVTTDNISGNDFEPANDVVYVTSTALTLRLGPSADTKELAFLQLGDKLTRSAKNSGWSKVKITINNVDFEGYVNNNYISTEKPTSTTTAS